jgi:peptidoglycan/xylan/chitin deacetylase (PgdA/CDA1 family)
MMFRRIVLSLALILFASVTIGVILGLDDAARGALASRLPSVAPVTASPEPADPEPADPPKVSATAKPKPTQFPTPTASRSPLPTLGPTRPSSPPGSSTPPPVTRAPRPTTTTAPRPTARPPARPSPAPTSAPPKKSSTAKAYLKGPLKKGSGGTVYLTFDDGPGVSTSAILSILSRTGSTATFFHLGVNEPGFPQADARIRAQGSKVASHSYDHPDLTTLTKAQLTRQVTHGPPAKCFRPPYGATNTAVHKAIAHAGMREVLWSVDTLDWTRPGVSTLARTGRLKSITNGSIVLMHDAGGDRRQTVSALPTVIADLHARGYRVRALPYC